MILSNIPHELRELNQWVAAGENKAPLNPRTGQTASVTDPSTWGTFHEAVSAGFRHIGFVLSASDPYAIIDLDNPKTTKVDGVVIDNPDLEEVARIGVEHARILTAFESYSEVSQSGNGIHIIIRAKLPRFGVRRGKVELYSAERYMICTGNVFKNLPITDQQVLADSLFSEMEQGRLQLTDLVETPSHLSDEQLYNLASTAENADKFNKLWRGDWQGNPMWPSQSEADYALLSMLAFYSPSNEQVRRMFRWSGLARHKTNKSNYHLDKALTTLRAKTPPPVDLSPLLKNDTGSNHSDAGNAPIGNQTGLGSHSPIETSGEEESGEGEAIGSPVDSVGKQTIALPPGFVGELANYFFESAVRPVPEIALCAAIALTAGVVGRSFNISGTGLNQYLLVLAKTGSGKEGAANGVDQLISAVRPTVPMIDEFIGPGAFASGQALVRVLDKCPCFASFLGEFGLTLNAMCSPNANGAQVMLKKVLLDIYAKSGSTKTLRSSVYSDSDKNTKSIQAPNVTIFGESNPEKFYEGLDGGIISEGLLPRFSIFEYTGPRPARNRNPFFAPPPKLVQYFGGLAAVAMQAQTTRMCSPVQMSAEALALLDAYDEFATDQINAKEADINRQLWNRAHLKALKMAALIAVAYNPHQPIISKEIANWSIGLIDRDVKTILSKFDAGEIGSGDVRLELDVRRSIDDYLQMSPTDRRGYGCPEKMVGFPAVPFQFLRRRLRLLKNFREDRRGANASLVATLNAMVEGEVLQRVTPAQAAQYCGTTSPVYVKGPAWN